MGKYSCSSWGTIGTLPSGYYPPMNIKMFKHTASSNNDMIILQSNGAIVSLVSLSNTDLSSFAEYTLN